jgi:hypothetical protein
MVYRCNDQQQKPHTGNKNPDFPGDGKYKLVVSEDSPEAATDVEKAIRTSGTVTGNETITLWMAP